MQKTFPLKKFKTTKSMTNPTRSSINISNRRPSSSSLDFHHRQSLLVIVNRLNGSTDSTSFHRSGDDGFAFEAQNVHAVSDPVAGAVSEDDDEAHEGYYVGDASGGRIGDGALDWGELNERETNKYVSLTCCEEEGEEENGLFVSKTYHCSATHAHYQDTCSTACVLS